MTEIAVQRAVAGALDKDVAKRLASERSRKRAGSGVKPAGMRPWTDMFTKFPDAIARDAEPVVH